MNINLIKLSNQSSLIGSVLKRYLAAQNKGTGAFSGGKLGGGVSKKGAAQVTKKVEIQVETDPEKLTKFCCGLNIYKTGGEEVPLKPDNEYPDWLWELKTDKGPTLEEMQPNTLEWWSRKRRIALRFKNKLMRKEFPKPFIPKNVKNMRLA